MCLSCDVCGARTGLTVALGVQRLQKEMHTQSFSTQRIEKLQIQYGEMRQTF